MNGTRLIHFSPDFIFDGTDGPYDESSVPNARGVYGKTKLQAEEIVEDYASIIRLCFPYRKDFAPKKDFVRSIASLLLSGVKLNMVTDALITPTFIDDIASGLDKMIDLPEKKIVHLVGSRAYSPFDCAIIIAKKIGANRELIGETTFEKFYEGKAPRPQYSQMISRNNDFWPMKSLEEGIEMVF